MRIYLYSKDESIKKMQDFFYKRTDKHIERVQKFCKKIYDYDPERFNGLIERGQKHDQSKYENPELDPYVYITWQYKCKDDGKTFDLPEGMDEKMSKATEHHVKHNKHHPEFHSPKEVDFINREDRDKPSKNIVDATAMKDIDIGEMVADWLAVSEEKNGNTRQWADKNVNIRWKFNKHQVDLIYELIENIEEK